jgi:hypothetical protein
MKLRILILSIFGIFVSNSCSSDSNSSNQNNNPSTILPKKVIYQNTADSYIYDFFYNQDKINYIKITTGDDYYMNYFTYDGDLITNITYEDSSQNILYIEDFTYSNNRLIRLIRTSINGEVIYDYVYNSDGTIIVTSPGGGQGIIYTYNNGMITKIFNKDITYFSTNSPFKNIKGIDNCYFTLNLQGGLLNKLFFSTKLNVNSGADYYYTYTYDNDTLFPYLVNEIRPDTGGQGTYNISYY